MLPAPLPVPFRLLPEQRCFANVGFEKCYLLHPPRPRGPHGDAFPSATHRCHPELVGLEGAATCGNLTGPLRDAYGTIRELLQEFMAIRDDCCFTQRINNGPRKLVNSM